VNDNHGHARGDQVLRDLSGFLRAHLRPGDHVARLGGEEFLLVMPRMPLRAALERADRLRTEWQAGVPMTTFSAGVAIHRDDESFHQTLARADAALYEAKDAGRNRVEATAS
jgi:diguanylate cyclase (GGDEF)-like protein